MVRLRLQTLFTVFFIVVTLSFGTAQDTAWKTDTADNGTTRVKSRISERLDENGVMMPLVEYVVSTTARSSPEKCVSIMKNILNHKEIMNTKVAEKLRDVSNAELLVYYYYKGMGPVADSDSVVTMIFFEDPGQKTATVKLTATPTLYEQKGVKRATLFDQTYVFKDMGEGEVEITIASVSSPAMKVPLWMIHAAFPKVAVNSIHRFVKLTK